MLPILSMNCVPLVDTFATSQSIFPVYASHIPPCVSFIRHSGAPQVWEASVLVGVFDVKYLTEIHCLACDGSVGVEACATPSVGTSGIAPIYCFACIQINGVGAKPWMRTNVVVKHSIQNISANNSYLRSAMIQS